MRSFDGYQDGLRRLLHQLGREHRDYPEALVLQARLQESITNAQDYGDNEIRRADRAQVLDALNTLALRTMGKSFNELCEGQEQKVPASETEGVRGLLEAMGYRIADTRTVGADIYFLCDVKWGVEICQEVVHFVGKEPTPGDIAALNDAVVSHDAARGILLTKQPLPPALRELASQRKRIRCYTLIEFTDRLADFRPYLERLIADYEASEIPQYYVPLSVEAKVGEGREPQAFKPVESFVDAWLTEPGRNHLSILGDFGSGKTWFCQRYAYLAAKHYLADPVHNRIPILITLRDYSRAYDVEQLVTDAIANRYKVSLAAGYKTFARLNAAGRLLLIFDGFDEMERRVSDYRTTVDNFWELAKVVGPTSKILLTCRTAYFRHRGEEEETLTRRRPRVNLIAGEHVIDLSDRRGFEIVHLLDFDDEDIQLALQKRLPTSWEPVYERIEKLANLYDLASRPVLLDMIVKTLPQIQDARQINQATLYETYVDALLRQRWSQDTDFISPRERRFFMQELAWEMYQTQLPSIPFSELPEHVATHFGLTDDLEQAAFFERDVRTQSYLVRDEAGNYHFAHRSFMEFFVASYLDKVLRQHEEDSEAQKLLKDVVLNPFECSNVLTFLSGISPRGKKLIIQLAEALTNEELLTCCMELVQALGRTGDNQAIPEVLRCLIRFYESTDRTVRASRIRDAVDTVVQDALELLGYAHLATLNMAWGASLCLEEYWQDMDPASLPLQVARALADGELVVANSIAELAQWFCDALEHSDHSFFSSSDEMLEKIRASCMKLLPSPECNAQMSLELDMEPTQTFEGEKVSEGIGYAFPVTGMIDFLCEIVEQAEDAPYKSQLEGMVGVLVKASYSMLAGQSSELKKRLENPEWKERWKAAYALGDWGDETASTALCTLLAKEDDPLVRSAAEIALRKLQTRLEARPGSS